MRLLNRKYFDVGGYFTKGSNWLQLRQKFVSRCSYLVNRKKILKHTILVELEAKSSASGGMENERSE